MASLQELINKAKKTALDGVNSVDRATGGFLSTYGPRAGNALNSLTANPNQYNIFASQPGKQAVNAVFGTPAGLARDVFDSGRLALGQQISPQQAQRLETRYGGNTFGQRLGNVAKNVGMDTLGTMATASGARTLTTLPKLATGLGVTGGFGAGVSQVMGGNPLQGAQQAMSSFPQIAGVSTFTNPLIDKIGGRVASKFNNPFTQQLAGRGAIGLSNVPEGMIMSGAMGRPEYGLKDAALDFSLGAITGRPKTGATIGSNLQFSDKKVMHPEDVLDLYRAIDGLNSPNGNTKSAIKTLNAIADGYLTPQEKKKYVNQHGVLNYGKLATALEKRAKYKPSATINDPFARQTAMGLYGGQTAKGYKPDMKGQFTNLTDKKVRFEIDDSKARIQNTNLLGDNKTPVRLSDILDHEELYRQYPQLKKLEISARSNVGGNGIYIPDNAGADYIKINTSLLNAPENLRSVLLHEIQHALQSREGFARGGSAAQLFYDRKGYAPYPTKGVDLPDLIKAKDDYFKIAGEVEARDVEARMNLSEDWREKVSPLYSQKIPLKDQIVRFDDGMSALSTKVKHAPSPSGGKLSLDDGELKYSVDDGKFVVDMVKVRSQKKGTGTALMREVENVARSRGYNEIELNAYPQNDSIKSDDLIRFYEKLGYEVKSTDEVFGEVSADMVKRLDLESPVMYSMSKPTPPPKPDAPQIVTPQTKAEAQMKLSADIAGKEPMRQMRELLGGEGLKDIAQVKRIMSTKSMQGGDLVRFSEKYPALYDRVLGRMQDVYGDISEDEAWAKAMSFPSRADIQANPQLKAQLAQPLDVYNAEPNQSIREKLTGTQAKAQAQQAQKEFSEWKRATMKQEGATIPATPTGAANQVAKQIEEATKAAENRKNLIGQGYILGKNDEILGFNATSSQKTSEKIRAEQAKQEFNEWKKQVYKQSQPSQTPNQAAKDISGEIKANTVGVNARNPETLKDLSGFMGQARDVYRNFKAVYGERFGQVKREILDPFDESKGKFIDDQKALLNDLNEKVVKGLGIKKGSKESAAVMQFGEGKRGQGSLIKEFGQEGAQRVMQADAYFRNKYDTLLDEVNKVRAKIYPNNPEKIIPKRSDYYRHFKEMQEGFAGLANIFETPSGISSKLSGVSPDTKPKSKFLSFAQKRLGDQSDQDAVGGFLNYAKSWSYAKNIDPHISKFRALADDLASQTAEGPNAGKLNNFIEYLQDYANDLSGKTNPADRFVQKVIPGGRTAMQALTWVNNRVKANTIVGNAGSMVAQFFNIPQGVASAGVDNSVLGIKRTLAGVLQKNTPLDKSNFMKERYASSMYDKFDTGLLANSKNFAGWITGVWDEMATKMIWNSHYEKAIRQGIPNPIKYSDDTTRAMVAGRGVGEQPLIQNSKLFQLAAPFQLEVGNLWHVLGEMKDKKEFGKIATLFVTMYGMNKIAEQIRGSDVGFDPIDALVDGYNIIQEEDDKAIGAIKATGRVAGEIISNVPLGQTVGGLYPEYGFKINEAQMPTRKDFFGDADPTRFGSGLLAQQALENPLYKVVPPYGGNQLQKTIEGLQSYDKGYSETATGKVRYPVDQTPINAIKSGVFGQYSTGNARDFFNSKGKPLGEAQSEEFKSGGGKDYYNEVMEDRAIKREDDKLNADPEKSFMQKLFQLPEVEEADASEGGRMVKDVFRYRDSNKKTQKFNTAPLPEGSSLSDLQERKDRASDARSLLKNSQLFSTGSKITEQEALQLIDNTGLDSVKIKYGAIDDLDTEGKAQYVDSVLNGDKFSEDEFNNLIDYGVLDTSLIKEMKKQGLVDEKGAESLTDLVKAREIQNGDRKAPKGRKLSIKGGSVKFSIPKSTFKISSPSRTRTSVGSVKLSAPPKIAKIKRPKIKAKRFKPRPIKAQPIRISG